MGRRWPFVSRFRGRLRLDESRAQSSRRGEWRCRGAGARAERLDEITQQGREMVFFCNSGSEAVEAALKLARAATGRANLLHCERSYHGKSFGAVSVTGNPAYQRPFGPLLTGCAAIAFGDLGALARAVGTRRLAALVVETVPGGGGMHVPPECYLREAQRLCRAAG